MLLHTKCTGGDSGHSLDRGGSYGPVNVQALIEIVFLHVFAKGWSALMIFYTKCIGGAALPAPARVRQSICMGFYYGDHLYVNACTQISIAYDSMCIGRSASKRRKRGRPRPRTDAPRPVNVHGIISADLCACIHIPMIYIVKSNTN